MSTHRSLRGNALMVLVIVLATLASFLEPADAAFPGKNGKIAFWTNRDGNLEIYVMDADGSNPTNLTNHPAADCCPAWSPDGTKIAFVSLRDGNSDIWVMDADGSNPTRLTNNTPAEQNGSPVWSPDGTKIAFARAAAPGFPTPRQIWVMDADGSNQTNLSNTATTLDEGPAWSPDGTKIAFHRGNPPGTAEDIWVMDTNGANQTRITFNFPFQTVQPDWSPDGAKIAFIRFSPAFNHEVYVMNADGTNQVQLTTTTAGENVPRWSPDGTKIAFNTNIDGNPEAYVMDADGSNQTNLTNNGAIDAVGSWRVRSLLAIDTQAGTSGRGALFRVNPITGARKMLSDFGNAAQGPLGNATTAAVAVEADNGILVADLDAGSPRLRGTLFRVNPTTGTRTVLSNFNSIAQGPQGQDPAGVAVEASGSILVIDITGIPRGVLFRVDPMTGSRSVLSNFANTAQGPRGMTPAAIALESNGSILVSDFSAGTGLRGALFRVNPTTGNRTLLSDFGDSAQGPLGTDPGGVAVESTGAILVVDLSAGTGGRGALFRIDPVTGSRTLFDNFGTAGQGPLGLDPAAVAVEPEGTIVVSDVTAGTGNRGALFRVDALTGTRTLFSDFGNNAQGPLGMNPFGVAVD